MPSRTRQPQAPSRSRFQEGSMNDRASAAPPVQFLENEENHPPASYYDDGRHNYQQAYQVPRKPLPMPTPTATVRAIKDDELGEFIPKPQQKEKTATKKSSRIFGQVWDGVFGMLSGKSSSNNGGSSSSSGRKKTPSMMSTASTATGTSARGRDSKEIKIDELRARLQQNDQNTTRPSKEDVMQSYQELVASGFFSSHAIQSTRHSRPGTAKSTAPSSVPPPDQRPNSPPQWPLSTPAKKRGNKQLLHQHQPHALSPIPMTPGSAGSRGTKRAAAREEDDEDQDAAPRSVSKKLRKSASRDVSGAGPRLRSVSSRRILSRRSFSGAPTKNSASPQALVTIAGPLQPTVSPSKLTKRCPPPSTAGRPSIRAPLPIPGRSSSASHQVQPGSRNISENVTMHVASDLDTRVLRPRRSALTGSEMRSVVPDVQRGIPGVPAIPPEFTYGEDREVGGPWRGLRR